MIPEVYGRLVGEARSGRMKKGEAILRYIHASVGGARFTDIQRFICDVNEYEFDDYREDIWTKDKFVWTTELGEFTNRYSRRPVGERFYIYHLTEINGYLFSIRKHLRKWDSIAGVAEYNHTAMAYGRILKTRALKPITRRASRGYYCTYLYGSCFRKGILDNCTKDENRRYYVKTEVVRKNFQVPMAPDRNSK